MAINITQQSITLSDVRTVIVTEVAQDPESGDYVRELRIFGDAALTPPITDIDAPPPAQGRLLLTIRLLSADRRRVAISVPAMEF